MPKMGREIGKQKLVLAPVENGGWTISAAPDYPGQMMDVIAAFSSFDDMLTALRVAVVAPFKEQEKTDG